jgi:hypothetical protein
MIRIEKLFFGFIIRAIIPIILFLASWWISLIFTKNEKIIAFCAIAGLVLGVIVSIIILRRQTDCYKLSNKSLVFIYLFYNVWFLGAFMGFPLFNIFWGLIAGIYFGRKLSLESADNTKVTLTSKKISLFTAIVMSIIVSFSILIVLLDKYKLENVKGTLGLSFDISPTALLVMVFAGGVALIILQYWITKLSVLNIFKISKRDTIGN